MSLPTPTALAARHSLGAETGHPVSAPAIGVTLDPIPSPLIVGANDTLTGTGFTAGSVVVMFVASATGTTSVGPFTPSPQSPTSLTFSIPASVALGNGFATVVVVNTDQGFIQSNPQSQYLFGAAGQNLPTITAINGVNLRPFDVTVPLASVETVILPGSTVTISGTGFNDPRVNLFTSGATAGGLVPLPGGSSTQIQVNIPANVPTGPGALQVVNNPFTPSVVSNAVSVPIGAAVSITSVSQMGTTVTVNGTGFSTASVINLFNAQGSMVFNLGGLWPTNGKPRVPLNLVSPMQFTFTVPPTALSGPAYIQVLNPPFIPFSTSGADPDGAFMLTVPTVAVGGGSLRFFGNGAADIDRVKIALDNPARPVDVGGDFTVEFWMKTAAGNASGACAAGGDNWMNGNTIIDRDVFGNGDNGDYGISLFGNGGQLAFGVNRMGTGTTICGATNVADGAWHHIAATRNTSSGQMRIFVDGGIDATGTGPTGDVSYRNGRATMHPSSDPFLVIGAEKHDTGPQFPSYHGWVDELRVSTVVRYGSAFTPPSAPFATDPKTAALYHFDEGNGDNVIDSALAVGGPSNGIRRFGAAPASMTPGPQWSPATPFTSNVPVIGFDTLTNALNSPTSITNAGDQRLFITEMGGTVRIWDGTQLLATPFLTVSPISSGGERGLLSIAFHPNYAQNGLFYVYYTNTAGNPTIARYHVSGDPNLADPTSGVVLLSINHPGQANHNGGQLQFGPDGYLYAGIGDGGGGCDNSGPGCNSQRDNELLGKLLRLDVNQNLNTQPFYGIPPDNPFVGPGGPLDEIYAKGLRNPWRFGFDRLTNSLFIGDVGQDTREEVDLQPSDAAGGRNYGWKRMEGFACDTCDVSDCPVAPPPCNDPSFTLPILDYGHNPECAIVGGYAYRGTQVPFLFGKYLFGDLCSGKLWWARDNEGTWSSTAFAPTEANMWTWGQDVYGELYLGIGGGSLLHLRTGP